MDRRMRQSLDEHIMGTHIRDEGNVNHSCSNCGHQWNARMFYELGGWFYKDDDEALCPECGHEGQARDEE